MTEREWGHMFRAASRVKPGTETPRLPEASTHSADFGTDLLQNHTAREISDLIDNKQTEIDDITKHVHTMPASTDAAWKTWSADWGKFLSDWNSIVGEARTYLQFIKNSPHLTQASSFLTSPVTWLMQSDPLDQATNEGLYQRILDVLRPTTLSQKIVTQITGAATITGQSRVQDLYRRYQTLPNTTPIEFRPLPKQYQKDGSLEFLKDTDPANLPNVVPNLLSKVPWWAWAAGGTLVLGAGVTVLKASPVGLLFKVLR